MLIQGENTHHPTPCLGFSVLSTWATVCSVMGGVVIQKCSFYQRWGSYNLPAQHIVCLHETLVGSDLHADTTLHYMCGLAESIVTLLSLYNLPTF